MSKKYANSNFRDHIYKSLQYRNKIEHGNIQNLIQSYCRIFDQSESLRHENSQLVFQCEQFKQDIVQIQTGSKLNSVSSPSSITASGITPSTTLGIQQYEQKIFKLQEEVSDLHRQKSDKTQQLMELSSCLQEKDRVIVGLQNKLAERDSEILLYKESLHERDKKMQEYETDNQLLRDEYQSLNLLYNKLDEKYQKAEVEIQELVKRWMSLKERDAEKLNEENEAVLRKRQELVEEKLKEASLEHKPVCEDDKFACVSPVCISASLPSKAYLNFDAHEGEVNALLFSPQGRTLATGGSDRRIKLWDVNHGTVDLKGVLMGSNATVHAIDFDGEESLVLGASNDFACRVWTAPDQRLRHTLTGHSGKVMASKFLSEPSKVITGSHDRTLKVWDLRSRSCTKTLFPGSSCNDVAVFDSQLTTIASGHFDKSVKFWDIRHEQPTNTVQLQGKVTSLSLSQGNFYLLCSVRDDTLRVIDLRTNKVIQSMSHEGFHIGADYTRAIFSPDNCYAACGSNTGDIYIWNVNSGKLEKQLQEHSSCVISLSWHPSGKMLASCDKAKKVLVWGDF